MDEEKLMQVAEAVRGECLRAAAAGYERASMDGLCSEGAVEVALEAIRDVDLAEICARFAGSSNTK